ncbi:DUF6624 domain-containing protein [Aquiflexum sp.]|uniref:DUF6624 domain-containing protein n=1 Tax=Aquiflexum sp. TaxID=1872584 RepID=UPI0035931080
MKILNFLFLITITLSCSESGKQTNLSETEQWKLGWRMISSSWNNDHQLVESQFDLLRTQNHKIDHKFLITGLKTLHALGKRDKIDSILNDLDAEQLQEICKSDLFVLEMKDVKVCENIEPYVVKNADLQMELIKMFVDDQAVRGNVMEDLIEKYGLNKDEVTQGEDGFSSVDSKNRHRLKEIFLEYGFPTKEMVGKDAMHGVFLMIQHADGETGWQKDQLSNIENAVKKGDMDGQSYAYLYDRIKINNGENQLYGTQFSDVDPENGTVTLAETADIDNLDHRRMEIGMMPIEMYKELMLKNIQK